MEISYQDLKRILKLHHQYTLGLMNNTTEGMKANIERANLSYMDLSGIELCGANLRFCNFAGCNLHNATLAAANLQAASLKGSNLSEAYFNFANLQAADLSCCNIEKTLMKNADLRAANFRLALINEADLSGSNLKGADFLGARGLGRANLQGTVYDVNTRWPCYDFLPEKMGAICEEEDGEFTDNWVFQTFYVDIPEGEVHHLRCRNCGREITNNNQDIEGVCQSCQGEGVRKLIAFDWFTGSRFFG